MVWWVAGRQQQGRHLWYAAHEQVSILCPLEICPQRQVHINAHQGAHARFVAGLGSGGAPSPGPGDCAVYNPPHAVRPIGAVVMFVGRKHLAVAWTWGFRAGSVVMPL